MLQYRRGGNASNFQHFAPIIGETLIPSRADLTGGENPFSVIRTPVFFEAIEVIEKKSLDFDPL